MNSKENFVIGPNIRIQISYHNEHSNGYADIFLINDGKTQKNGTFEKNAKYLIIIF